MENVRKLARSQSVKVTELLKLPSQKEDSRNTMESKGSVNGDEEDDQEHDTDQPTTLPILRVAGHEGTKQQRREKQRENKDKVNGNVSEGPGGKICYDDVLHLLTCPSCSSHVSAPVTQCRRGHVYCRDCAQALATCLVCRQGWVDTPNNTLDNIIKLIALPCKYGYQGCPVITFQSERLAHQTVCEYRPVYCQYSSHGCETVLAVKDISWHHKICTYSAVATIIQSEIEQEYGPQAPDLPPTRKKSVKVKK